MKKEAVTFPERDHAKNLVVAAELAFKNRDESDRCVAYRILKAREWVTKSLPALDSRLDYLTLELLQRIARCTPSE